MMMTGGPNALQMRCLHNRRDPRVCEPNRVPLDVLEAIVLDRLHKQLAQYLDVDGLTESMQKDDSRFRARRSQLNQRRKELRQLENQLQALYFQRTAGTLTAEQFTTASQSLADRKKALEQEVEQLLHCGFCAFDSIHGSSFTVIRQSIDCIRTARAGPMSVGPCRPYVPGMTQSGDCEL